MGKLLKSTGWMGNIAENDTSKANDHVATYFNTNDKDGVPIAPSVGGSVRVYVDGSDTQSTASGWVINENAHTDGVHFAWLPGSPSESSPDKAEAGHDYTVFYRNTTIDGEVVNGIVCSFSCVNRN